MVGKLYVKVILKKFLKKFEEPVKVEKILDSVLEKRERNRIFDNTLFSFG